MPSDPSPVPRQKIVTFPGDAFPAPPIERRVKGRRWETALRARLTWLFVFRAVALTLVLGLTVGLRYSVNGGVLGPGLVKVSAVCIAGFASILAGGLWLRFRDTLHIARLAQVQVVLDCAITTLLIWLTGGVESGFVFLYTLAVLGAAAVLERRGAFIIAGLVGVLYTGMVMLEVAGYFAANDAPLPSLTRLLPPYFVNVLAFFLVAFLAGFLSEQLRRTSASLVQAREQVFALEKLSEAVLQSLPSGVLTVDDNERVLFVNRAATDLLGQSQAALIGESASTLLPGLPDGPPPERARLEFEIVLGEDNDKRDLSASAANLTGLEGRTGRVIIFDDRTELLRLQREASRHQELATVGRFAAGLAHEIRNPLAAMVGCINLLEQDIASGSVGAETERLVTIVQSEAERLSTLVSVFLTYARPAHPRREDVTLATLVHDTVDAIVAGENLDDDIDVKVEVWASPTVRCDPAQIRQVTWNLLRNAFSAVAGEMGACDASRNKVVRLTIDATDRVGVLVVEDSGPGIAEEDREQVLEPFFTTRTSGTGLGLAECHQLLAAQAGRLEVGRSEDLGGARMEVSLPLVAFAEVSRPTPVAQGREEPVPHPGLKRRPITSDVEPVPQIDPTET